jgi:hypothetical protein
MPTGYCLSTNPLVLAAMKFNGQWKLRMFDSKEDFMKTLTKDFVENNEAETALFAVLQGAWSNEWSSDELNDKINKNNIFEYWEKTDSEMTGP